MLRSVNLFSKMPKNMKCCSGEYCPAGPYIVIFSLT